VAFFLGHGVVPLIYFITKVYQNIISKLSNMT